jgi:hypothetical protein
VIKSFAKFNTSNGQDFPDDFHYNFHNDKDEKFEFKFIRIGILTKDPEYEPDVYVHDDDLKLRKIEKNTVCFLGFLFY